MFFFRKNVENQWSDTLPSRHVYQAAYFLTPFHTNGNMRNASLRRHDEAMFKNIRNLRDPRTRSEKGHAISLPSAAGPTISYASWRIPYGPSDFMVNAFYTGPAISYAIWHILYGLSHLIRYVTHSIRAQPIHALFDTFYTGSTISCDI